jgi:LiaI-LiaF-like transmembrane region
MGPAVLITIGVLFLLQQVRGADFGFDNTYPFILIVIGAILVASSLAPMDGHIPAAAVPPAAPPPSGSVPNPPQGPMPGQGH